MEPNFDNTNMNFSETAHEDKTGFREHLQYTAEQNNNDEYKEGEQITNPEGISKISRIKKFSRAIKMFAFLLVIAARVAFSSYTNNSAENSLKESQIDPLIKESTIFAGESEWAAKKNFRLTDLLYNNFNNTFTNKLNKNYFESPEINQTRRFIAGSNHRNADDVEAMFSFAGFTGINQQPIHFNLSGVSYLGGNTMANFSAPAFAGTASFSQFPVKSFTIPLYTIGIWKDGVMTEGYLFRNNMTYITAIGLGK